MMPVAVGIIRNPAGDILIAKRPLGKYKSGLWEFPGGKIEANETIFQALQRELLEEIGIHVISAESWLTFEYDYQDRVVLLHVWNVTEYTGEPHGLEGQPVRWVPTCELNQYEFPAGNARIVENLMHE